MKSITKILLISFLLGAAVKCHDTLSAYDPNSHHYPVSVTPQLPVTTQIPVTTQVPVTYQVPVTQNVEVIRQVPVTQNVQVTHQVPVTYQVPVTTQAPVQASFQQYQQPAAKIQITSQHVHQNAVVAPSPTPRPIFRRQPVTVVRKIEHVIYPKKQPVFVEGLPYMPGYKWNNYTMTRQK